MHQKEEHSIDLWDIQIKATYQPQHNSSGWFPHLTLTNRQFAWEKKLDREAVEMNKIINQMDLADIYSIFHSNSREHTFFPAAMGMFFKIGYMLGHKASPSKAGKLESHPESKCKKIEITSCSLLDSHSLKMGINNKRQKESTQIHGRWMEHEETNWVEEEIKREM